MGYCAGHRLMKTVFLHCCWGMIRDEVLSAIIFFETETVSKHLMFFQLDYPDVLALQMFSALFIYFSLKTAQFVWFWTCLVTHCYAWC